MYVCMYTHTHAQTPIHTQTHIFVNYSDSKSFWHSIDKVLHCSSASNTDPSASHFAHQFILFFTVKIKSLRANLPL